MSPTFKRKSRVIQNAEDSNSDEESLKQLISDSKDQLTYAEEIYKQVKLGINNHLVTNEIVSFFKDFSSKSLCKKIPNTIL